MSTEYAVWQQQGLGKRESWMIVCQIVHRIFEDMQSAQISARSALHQKDTNFSMAAFIYATLKCHSVLMNYVKHWFHHRSVESAVFMWHLAANFIKPESGTRFVCSRDGENGGR